MTPQTQAFAATFVAVFSGLTVVTMVASKNAWSRRRSGATNHSRRALRTTTTTSRTHRSGGEYYHDEEKDARIVNGTEVRRNRYPYMAALVGGYYYRDARFYDTDGSDEFAEDDDDWFSRGIGIGGPGGDRSFRTTPVFDRSEGVKIFDYEDATLIVDVRGGGGRGPVRKDEKSSTRTRASASCGASLVMPDVVLSAAHCDPIANYVMLGRHDLQSGRGEGETFEMCEIIERVIHPQYDNGGFDFALFKLDCKSEAPIVKLNDDPNVPGDDGTELTVMGWGRTHTDGPPSDVPLKAKVDYMSNRECRKRYGYGAISDDMLCAWRKGRDACQGDSGGPLIIKGKSYEDDTLVGVVSWGDECAHDYLPGVYARVSAAIDWIKDEMCLLSETKC